jgi:hypothetical protein
MPSAIPPTGSFAVHVSGSSERSSRFCSAAIKRWTLPSRLSLAGYLATLLTNGPNEDLQRLNVMCLAKPFDDGGHALHHAIHGPIIWIAIFEQFCAVQLNFLSTSPRWGGSGEGGADASVKGGSPKVASTRGQ